MAKFSIIVPVYNAASFVVQTIENILRQNVDKEIILINDGSTDNSLDILKDYEMRNEDIRVIDKINSGVSSTRNVGLDAAIGDFVCFIDSDDFIEDGTLERCEKIFEEQNPDCVFFSYKYVFPNQKRKDEVYEYLPTGLYTSKEWLFDFFRLNSIHIINCIGTTIYRRDILEHNMLRFNESISYYEDVGFCTQYLGYTSRIYYINEPLYHYRIVNKNSLITKHRPHFSLCADYLRVQQKNMMLAVFGEDSIPYKEMYAVFGDSIISCIANLFSGQTVDDEEIYSELNNMSSNSDIKKYIECVKFEKQKKILRVLLEKDVNQQRSYFIDYYKKISQRNKVINYFRRIKRGLLNNL